MSTPLFTPFEWVGERHQADTGRYTMLSTIRDLASGVGLALQIVERSAPQEESGADPVIDASAALRFTKMSIAAVSVIERYIDEHFDDLNDRAIAKKGSSQ